MSQIFAQNSLASLEKRLILASHDENQLRAFEFDFQEFCTSIKEQVEGGAFTSEELCLYDEQAARIKHIALYFSELERIKCDLVDKAKKDARCIFLDDHTRPAPRTEGHNKGTIEKTVAPVHSIQETLNSKVLRRWFLDNVADPFPNRKTKEELIAKTNTLVEAAPPVKKPRVKSSPQAKSNQPIDYTQCSLWFVNSRRRSQWTDFFREFARSDKILMRRLVECLKREEELADPGKNTDLERLLRWDDIKREVDSDDSSNPQTEEGEMAARVKECRETYIHIMEWLQQVSKDKVGDWMDEVISEARKELKVEKAARRVTMKRKAEEIEMLHEERDHQRQRVEVDRQMLRTADVNIRQMNRILRSRAQERKPRLDYRRVPSTFRTPDVSVKQTQFSDSSIRNTSNGSTNWNSSADSQYAPSLFEKHDLRSSSSSSSLASYDNFVKRVPASPTLSILKNSQPKPPTQSTMKPAQMDAGISFNAASLYTSDLAPPYQTHPQYRTHLHPATPASWHLETELSGGIRSPAVSRTVSQASSISEGADIVCPWR